MTNLSKWIFLTSFICITLNSCSQPNSYINETKKLIDLIKNNDTIAIKNMVVGKVEDSKFFMQTIKRDVPNFSKLLRAATSTPKYIVKEYPTDNFKICDVIVTVEGSDNGELTASFYRKPDPTKVFIFFIIVHHSSQDLIKSPD